MLAFSLSGFLLLLSVAGHVSAAQYSISDTFQGNDFLNNFDFFTDADPTNGYVNYVSKADALAKDLVQVSGNNFTLRADDQNVPSTSARGRDSVRITSQKAYNTHVSIYNVAHMPKGCGTWPAIWEVGNNWPNEGEVDIVEGTNLATANVASLHTGPGCTVPPVRTQMTGNPLNNNCVSGAGSNAGCNVQLTAADSFGHPFNTNGGGIYAMERASTGISIWFWARNDQNVPAEVANGAATIDTSTWGTADVVFPDTGCNITNHFGNHNIVINLTFCGDLAGATYPTSGCPSTCQDFVQNNPGEFNWAFFSMMWIKVYE
ncbi:2 beta-glucan [Vararia minispora EC-137]|uniref:2 beta-glucan n=1 Tax=Vararia minispora EC-137 TaxID=1314806 RepID=A0ACB8QH05_9AGAM|nr:2 beta-glucan [Vararia minispora EC-137]